MATIKIYKVTPVNDQLITCIADAIEHSNRYLEPFLHYSPEGRLSYVEVRTKALPHVEVIRLYADYDLEGKLERIGGFISVELTDGLINYERIFNQLIKIIPQPDQAYP